MYHPGQQPSGEFTGTTGPPESGRPGGRGPGGFAGTGDALAAVASGLAFLARADAASLPMTEVADCLRELERAESAHTAARAKMLTAFTAQAGYEGDGHGGPRAVAHLADPDHRRRR